MAHPRLFLVEGDPGNKVDLDTAMKGCEAVISALNISRTSDWPWAQLRTEKNFLSRVAQLIIELAPSHNIRRYIFTSAWGVAETRKDIPGWFRWFIEHSNIRYPYEDHARAEGLLQQSHLEFTSVRTAGLTNSKKLREIIVSFNNVPKPRLLISRRNLAGFILDVLGKEQYIRQMPVVSHK